MKGFTPGSVSGELAHYPRWSNFSYGTELGLSSVALGDRQKGMTNQRGNLLAVCLISRSHMHVPNLALQQDLFLDRPASETVLSCVEGGEIYHPSRSWI
uniref:Uncharacterized protein n=1 Tax=Physcomitrium patens TaxID=3218 RepID=A0A2K1L778_PHYPA|nr:hypothetical protein PHYPA_000320 [Physcomitrium patens]